MSRPVVKHPRRAAMMARLPVPQAASSTFIPGRSSIRAMNCSAIGMINFATCPKSPLSQVDFWRALMDWISGMGFAGVVFIGVDYHAFFLSFGFVVASGHPARRELNCLRRAKELNARQG